MPRIVSLIMIVLAWGTLLPLASEAAGPCTDSRLPVIAGTFYPNDAAMLTAMIAGFESRAGLPRLPSTPPRALILPHAGYIYSGPCAGFGVKALKNKSYGKVIVLGPDHRIGFRGVAITGHDGFRTPLGDMPLHPVCRTLAGTWNFLIQSPGSDRTEHSLEAVLPYLQYSLGNLPLVPLTVGDVDPEALVDMVNGILAPGDLLVVSSDLSHFLDYDQARTVDKKTLDRITALDAGYFLNTSGSACGRIGIHVLLKLAEKRGWTPFLLSALNSGDTAGSKQSVVGYAALAFYDSEDTAMKTIPATPRGITPTQGRILLKLARQTIAEKLGIPVDPGEKADLGTDLKAPVFQNPSGTFVTLTIKGALRGCIGTIEPVESMADGIRGNARNAAFRDPRFSPLTRNEFDDVHIEVSLLTKPEKLDYTDGDDLISKLKPGVHGVILEKSYHRATFLPQVWEQLPRPEDFLTHLCRKAGLGGNEWKDGQIEVFTYGVEYFEEPK
ncbi:MAG: AmmeMemoRadiSam system protein B [Pseudomonadota bacterium]